MTENYNTGGWNKDVLGGKKNQKINNRGGVEGGGAIIRDSRVVWYIRRY